jgi:decaprenyl-phosphate phosphoribosyltransferase
MFVALLQSLRPHQWVKNFFVVAPLLFSKNLADPKLLVLSGIAFVLFSLLSGSVYLVNDIFDIEKDKLHPRKRYRPIPSGRLPMMAARSAAALLIVISLGASLALDLSFFAAAASYLIINLAYSLALKHIPLVDVFSIASGFLLRVLAGSYAIKVFPSFWLLVCTFVLACFLGFGKRAHELAAAVDLDKAKEQRPVLGKYRLSHLIVILWILAAATCGVYVLYTLSPHTQSFFGTDRLLYTSPFAAIGVIRFLWLVSRHADESPTDAMLRDVLFMVNLCGWAVSVVLIIYFFPS